MSLREPRDGVEFRREGVGHRVGGNRGCGVHTPGQHSGVRGRDDADAHVATERPDRMHVEKGRTIEAEAVRRTPYVTGDQTDSALMQAVANELAHHPTTVHRWELTCVTRVGDRGCGAGVDRTYALDTVVDAQRQRHERRTDGVALSLTPGESHRDRHRHRFRRVLPERPQRRAHRAGDGAQHALVDRAIGGERPGTQC